MDSLRVTVPEWGLKTFIIFFVIPPLNWFIREYVRRLVGVADLSGLHAQFWIALGIYILADIHKGLISLLVEALM
ncbi:hypothetical protein F5B17DRAFT_385870 [Nemania serpens]|nr:hypothetical protein F5B17DRAFT_385870 [Nemania serpens]